MNKYITEVELAYKIYRKYPYKARNEYAACLIVGENKSFGYIQFHFDKGKTLKFGCYIQNKEDMLKKMHTVVDNYSQLLEEYELTRPIYRW